VGLLLLLLIPATVLTVQFFSNVQAGLQELLPKEAPSVQALNKLHALLGGKSHLTVIAQSPDPDANRRFIALLSQRLHERHIPEAKFILGDIRSERQWIKDHAALLMPKDKFNLLADELDAVIARAKAAANPLYVDVDDAEPPEKAWEKVEKKLDSETRTFDRFPRGFLETPDGKTVVLLVDLQGSEVDLEPAVNLQSAVQREVAAIRSQFPANLLVAYNGEVPNLIEEHDAILADLSLSSIIVFLLVGALISFYFRSVRGVAAVMLSLGPGLLCTFAIGRLSVGHLNSNTAFLGSIIAGNGINYPLLLLAYYRVRPQGERRDLAILAAAKNAFPGTLGAAVTASAAYSGLAVSTFKGFSQFGWLGGIGMVTTWVLTFVSMPIAISVLNPPRQEPRATPTQRWLTRFFSRRYLPYALASLFIAVALFFGGLGVRYALHAGLYEMDLQTLRNRDSLRSGSASWDAKMSELFGVWLNPVAGVVEDPGQREAAADEFRHALTIGNPAVAERVETISAYVPAEAEQKARIVRLRDLARSLQKADRDQIPPRARPYVDSWLAEANLRVLSAADVPPSLIKNFAELSGRTDRVILIFPSLKINYNDGRNIIHFADELARTPKPPGEVVGGSFLFMAEILRLVRDEAPRVVLTVCMLVALVLVPFFRDRPLRIPLVVLTVAAVAITAQSVMLALGVQLNMLNFAAIPITIGVGADYVVNLLGAMDAFEVDARRACARMGGAIFLCSLTTVVGYVSLLIAQSGALRTFGWAAVLGEVMAVLVVLLVLPAIWARPLREPPAV
jgi:predicted RND superfamily exporter protein